MGIKGLTKLLKKRAPDSIREASYSEFAGQVWAVDASGFIYQFSYNQQGKRQNSCLDGFYKLIIRLRKFGIEPLMVNDGQKPIEKASELEDRAEIRQNQKNSIAVLQSELDQLTVSKGNLTSESEKLKQAQEISLKTEELKKAEKSLIRFDPDLYDNLNQLFDLLGVRHYRANWEADALCTKLSQSGVVDNIMSEDSDMLLYQGKFVARKFNYSDTVELIDLSRVLSGLKINYDQFIDLCLLCGSDYTDSTIMGIGPMTAHDFIQSGLTIEMIIDNINQSSSGDPKLKKFKNYILPPDGTFDYQSARQLVKTAHSKEDDISRPPVFCLEMIDVGDLTKFMAEKCNYRPSTVHNHINELQTLAFSKKPKIKLALKSKLA
jgi:flap endonuclease-1